MTHIPSAPFSENWPQEVRELEHQPAPAELRGSGLPGEFQAKHILAVDDDPAVRVMISDYLVDQNMRVSTAADGREMARVLATGGIDLVILDLKLGDEDGLEHVRSLRADSDLPIIVLSGHHRREVDRVVGLELGADDYLTKPFSLRELLARIRAILRRRELATRRSALDAKRRRYRVASWELGLRTRRLTSPSGEIVPLTRGELAVLTAFLQSPQQVLSREQLLAASRIHDNEVFDRSIDVQVLRLRRKIEADPAAPELIKTERGAGYYFSATVEVA
jgi:two-component system OmpR family response regulator